MSSSSPLTGWRKAAAALTGAYRELLQGRRYGPQKFPAVVFDGHAVVNGVADLRRPLGDYRRWRAGSP